jgi:hypothetical protein
MSHSPYPRTNLLNGFIQIGNNKGIKKKLWFKAKWCRKEGEWGRGEGKSGRALCMHITRGDDTEWWSAKCSIPTVRICHISSLLCDGERQTLGGNSPDLMHFLSDISKLCTEMARHEHLMTIPSCWLPCTVNNQKQATFISTIRLRSFLLTQLNCNSFLLFYSNCPLLVSVIQPSSSGNMYIALLLYFPQKHKL